MNDIKAVIVGDDYCGKTMLLKAMIQSDFKIYVHEPYVPTVFDNFSMNLHFHGVDAPVLFWDTAGQEDFDRLRHLSYKQTDVVLVTFDIANPVCFENVEKKWLPHVHPHMINVPRILVGTKSESGPNGPKESNTWNIDEVTVADDDQPNVDTDQPVNENSTMSRTVEVLKDSTSALKSANEAITAMSSMVVGLLANKDASSSSSLSNPKTNYDFASAYQTTYGHITLISSVNAEQTFHRQVVTSKGIVFAEDLPKMDYVSTSLRKQILEGKDIHLSLLLYPKNEVPQTRTVFSEGLTVELSAPKDPRLEKSLTLNEFNKVFRKFRNIICKVYPQLRDELNQYDI
ncbi:Hypothetical predicted protein [Mytilus galloprovincialis]|uniref:Uncharacterized protein n=1 Tax=Mytilus galloprovincialis TaxID=29158 RepID=A0A8B6H036_MYTGA|nr:Hypothetical predicted protein [Mytilus galloprovincialis]